MTSRIRSPCRPCRRRGCGGGFLLGLLGDHGLGRDQQAGNRCGVLQRGAHDLGRVDHAGLDQILVLLVLGVETVVPLLALEDLAGDDGTVEARVLGDLAGRELDRLLDDVDADLLIGIVDLELVERPGGEQQRAAAAGHDAFLHRSAGGVHRVLDQILAFLDLDLGRTADLDHRDAAGEFREPLLQLLPIIVRRGALDLLADLVAAPLDVALLARAADDRGVVLLDDHALGLAKHAHGDVLELDSDILADHLTAGEDRDILEHGLAAVAEARRLARPRP